MTPAEPATLRLTLRDSAGHEISVCAPHRLVPQPGASGLAPALKFGESTQPNTLWLTLQLQGHGSPCQGLALHLHADDSLLAEAALPMAVVTCPPGWRSTPLPDPFTKVQGLALICEQTLVMDGRQHEATFVLAELQSSQDAWTAGAITVVALHAPQGLARAGVDLTVRTTDLRVGPLQVAWAAPCNGQIICSRGTQPLKNPPLVNPPLRLRLTNAATPSRPLVERVTPDHSAHPPVVSFRLRYADTLPGYGALCSRAQVQRAPPRLSLENRAPGSKLDIAQVGTADEPYWELPLANSTETLLESDSVVVVLEGLVCDLPLRAAGNPDATELLVSWQHIPGLANGSQALALSKEDATLIVGPHCVQVLRGSYGKTELRPWQPGTAIDYGQLVGVSWRTLGALRSHLVGGREDQKHDGDGLDTEHSQAVRPQPGAQVFQVAAFDALNGNTPTALSPPLIFAFAPPRIEGYSADLQVLPGGELALDLSWIVSNAEHCELVGASAGAGGPEAATLLRPRVQAHRVTPPAAPAQDWRPPDGQSWPRVWGRKGKKCLPDISLYASGSQAQTTSVSGSLRCNLQLGDFYAGGLIFQLDDDRQSGMVVEEVDSGFMMWRHAVQACETLELFGYTDWHAPSLQQWMLINQVLFRGGVTAFGAAYWSTTAFPPAEEHYLWVFRSGNPATDERPMNQRDAAAYPIRAVRRFTAGA